MVKPILYIHDVVYELIQNNADCTIIESGGLSVVHYMFDIVDDRESIDINIIKCLVEYGKFDVNTAHVDMSHDDVCNRSDINDLNDIQNCLIENRAIGRGI